MMNKDLLQFLAMYGQVVVALSRLLGMRFVEGSPDLETRIGKSVIRILAFWNRREYERSWWELSKLGLFAKHLAEVESYDTGLLAELKASLSKGMATADQYFGARFETNITASLIRAGASFTKRESPDFEVRVGRDTAYIECSSGHFAGSKRRDFWRKMRAVIEEKMRKPYCAPNVALFIDMTNVYATAFAQRILPDREDIRDGVRRILRGRGQPTFGNVTLFAYIFNRRLSRFESNYVRADDDTMTDTLRTFLDECYPLGDHTLTDYAVPSEG